MEVTSAQESTVTTIQKINSRREYRSKAYLTFEGVKQEKARGNLYSHSQCASLIWSATTASLPWRRQNLQRQSLLLLLDPNPLAGTISMFWLIKAPPARSRGEFYVSAAIHCFWVWFTIAAHRTALANWYYQFRKGFAFPWKALLCHDSAQSRLQLRFYITAGILTLPPLMALVAQAGPNNLLAELWFWTNDPPTDQWPPGLQIRPSMGSDPKTSTLLDPMTDSSKSAQRTEWQKMEILSDQG